MNRKPPALANPPASRAVKDTALSAWPNIDRKPSHGYIDAVVKKVGRPVALVDGILNMATYRAIVAEANEKGLDTKKVTIYSTQATYSGLGIDTILYRDVPGFDDAGELLAADAMAAS